MIKHGDTVTISIDDTDTVGDGLYTDIIDAFRYQIERDHGVELHESNLLLGKITIVAEILDEKMLDD